MVKIALRDTVRSSFLGPMVRDLVVIPYRRYQRRAQARIRSKADKNSFKCSVCGYTGLFVDHPIGLKPTGRKLARQYACCPECGAGERHRLQANVLNLILPEFSPASKSALHFAPEPFFANKLKASFGTYKTSDLFRRDADIQADISDLPIPDASFDLVYASHVLEHVPEDRRAIKELYRILKPGGIAVLPVPIYSKGSRSAEQTVEYMEAVKEEDGHVRAPGLDYFDRYRAVFDEVRVYTSAEFPVSPFDNQLYIRQPSQSADGGYDILPDYVPICRKN